MNSKAEFLIILGLSFFFGVIAIIYVKWNHGYSSGEATIWGGIISILLLQIFQVYKTVFKQEPTK